jgi:hypothetical protein
MPVLTGCPDEIKIPRKRNGKRRAETAQLGEEQPTRRVLMRDTMNVGYWEDYDEESKGQVIGRFCHELHENVIDTFYSKFPTAGTDPKIRRMAADAQTWYLGQRNAVETGESFNICNYYSITLLLAKGLPVCEEKFIAFVNEHHTQLRQLDSDKLWKEVREPAGLPNYDLGNLNVAKPTAWMIFKSIRRNEELRSHSRFIHDIAPVS